MTFGFALIVATCLAAEPAQAPAQASATYYLGESNVTTPDGKSLGNLVTLIKREQFPAQGKIVETMVLVSSNRREPATEYVSVWVVEGSNFRVKEQSNAFSGKGELTGKSWDWSGWTIVTQTAAGIIRGHAQRTERGLTIVKELVGPDGVTRAKYTEDHAKIDGGTYELFRTKLLPRAPK